MQRDFWEVQVNPRRLLNKLILSMKSYLNYKSVKKKFRAKGHWKNHGHAIRYVICHEFIWMLYNFCSIFWRCVCKYVSRFFYMNKFSKEAKRKKNHGWNLITSTFLCLCKLNWPLLTTGQGRQNSMRPSICSISFEIVLGFRPFDSDDVLLIVMYR